MAEGVQPSPRTGERYDPHAIESKWRARWQESGLYRTDLRDDGRPKYYNLMEFPYPSAEGLHVGHVYNYSGADANSVLFNFPDASVITAYNYGFFGTVLAPGADFSFSNGSFDGGIYAGSLTGNAEGHVAPLRVFRICGYWGDGQ